MSQASLIKRRQKERSGHYFEIKMIEYPALHQLGPIVRYKLWTYTIFLKLLSWFDILLFIFQISVLCCVLLEK